MKFDSDEAFDRRFGKGKAHKDGTKAPLKIVKKKSERNARAKSKNVISIQFNLCTISNKFDFAFFFLFSKSVRAFLALTVGNKARVSIT